MLGILDDLRQHWKFHRINNADVKHARLWLLDPDESTCGNVRYIVSAPSERRELRRG